MSEVERAYTEKKIVFVIFIVFNLKEQMPPSPLKISAVTSAISGVLIDGVAKGNKSKLV